MSPLHPEVLTWTGLLAQWIDYARGAVALPDDAEGDRWRASIAPIITLQAVTFALADLERLDAADRAVARDKAAVLIEQAVGELNTTWTATPMPDHIIEITSDAQMMWRRSTYAGTTELIWGGDQPGVIPAIELPDRSSGTLAMMHPGTIVMPGEPVAWWADRDGVEIKGCTPQPAFPPRQVYRQLDDDGLITGDLVVPIDAEAIPGMPLIVPLTLVGEPIGEFQMDADVWEQQQREAMTAAVILVTHLEDPAAS